MQEASLGRGDRAKVVDKSATALDRMDAYSGGQDRPTSNGQDAHGHRKDSRHCHAGATPGRQTALSRRRAMGEPRKTTPTGACRTVLEEDRRGESFTPKPCTVFTPSSFAGSRKEVGAAGVLLCTNQTLQALQKDPARFRKLRNWCQLVLVDEGHREPAPRWAEAVRELESPLSFSPPRHIATIFNCSMLTQPTLIRLHSARPWTITS